MRFRSHPPARRAGHTLIEVLIAVVMVVLVFAAASPLFQQQARLLDRQAGRADAIQTARFVAASIERELRIAGPPNEIEEQPLLVQADPYAVTMNVDLNSRDTSSASAVYFDPDIDPSETQALTPARAVRLPRSSVVYPAVAYASPAGIRSDAETVSYWLARDTGATRADVYTLWRRVNDADSTIVARNLVVRSGRPFFEYLQPGAGDTLRPIAANRLPAFHTVTEHGTVGDTGSLALVDEVRELRVTAEVLYSDPRMGDTTYTSQFRFRLLNSGLIRRTTCGTAPRAVVATATPQPGGVVRIGWSKSVDDGSGEEDVQRYTLFRRLRGTTDWGEPFRGVQARGAATYEADDTEAKVPGDWWEYSVIAQDCTPMNSPRAVTPAIRIL
ncbi:MAG TPA: prepilin-type N-terminal cleavage/methylation domain-containing protein [Gemmatimonadaceae bacterium]|nr:prepilin-type N-terminal cleavage/methylation domain-containing protein [Gemmatimonadaceae bacterium]